MAADEMLRKALAEQEAELQKLDRQIAELRPLQIKRDNLSQLVAQMRFNLGMEPYRSPEVLQPPKEGPGGKRPIWEAAMGVLQQSKMPMSTAEIAEVLLGLGYVNLAGRPGRETIRTLLAKKKNIFEKKPDGRFALKTT